MDYYRGPVAFAFFSFSTLRSSHIEIAIPSINSSRIASYGPAGGHYSGDEPVGDVPPRLLGVLAGRGSHTRHFRYY
jgi:hypothetical protein